LCEALQHAHNHTEDGRKRAVYHRNVSPETVFLTKDGVKLADFDFAKYGDYTITSVPSKNPADQQQILPDKPFTPPEMLKVPPTATAASDIYSLGVLWYFLASLPTYKPNDIWRPEQAERMIDALNLPTEVRSLMKRMVDTFPSKRPKKIEDVASALKQLRENE